MPALKCRSERFTTETLGEVALHVLLWGNRDSRALVLLHGGGANAHWWDHLAPVLAEDFNVVALDFRGHGDSDHPAEIAAAGFDGDLDALLEHLGTPDALLMGHSMGAHVALRHAAREVGPRAVVALECSRGGGTAPRRARLALATRRTYATRDEALRRFQFLPAAPAADPALRLAIAEHSIREEPDGRFGYKFDPRWFSLPARNPPDLSRISVPVLLVRGSESSLLTAEGAAALAAEIPDARVSEIAGAGHNVQIERPSETLAAVRTFLAPFR